MRLLLLGLLSVFLSFSKLNAFQPYFPTFKNSTITYIDTLGTITGFSSIPSLYESTALIDPVSGDSSFFVYNYEDYIFENGVAVIKQGRALLPFTYGFKFTIITYNDESESKIYAEKMGLFTNNVYPVKKTVVKFNPTKSRQYEWNYLDSKLQPISKKKYDFADSFSEGFARVRINRSYGFISTDETLIIEPRYQDALNFSENLAAVMINKKWGFINKSGLIVIKPDFDKAYSFQNGIAKVIKNKKIGYLKSNGDWLIEPTFDFGSSFSEGFAVVYKDSVTRFIDTRGDAVSEEYQNGLFFSEGFAAVQKNGKWGFINTNWEWVIPPIYLRTGSFNQGLGIAWKGKIPYYINKKGVLIAEVIDLEEINRLKQDKVEDYLWEITKLRAN